MNLRSETPRLELIAAARHHREELIPSRRVLAPSGFACLGEGSEPGVLRHDRHRSSTLPWAESHLPFPA